MSTRSSRKAADLSRRSFLGSAAGGTALVAVAGHLRPQTAWAALLEDAKPTVPTGMPESLVKVLFESFSATQKQAVCFAWDYQHPKMGLLRTRVENNWNITEQHIDGDFYTGEQRDLMRKIYEGMLNPDWVTKVDRQLKDDAGGWGKNQAIALFGTPGSDGKFEMVMTGRHLTLRCDGNTAEHVAFGGPIFHGHAAGGFNEKPNHPNNIFWPQALEANKIFTMLDGKQRDLALVKKDMPDEEKVEFQGPSGKFQGIPITDLSADQKSQVQKVLSMLIEPYRQCDRDEVVSCLKTQGGLDACHLAFYEEGDIGNDGVYDVWRLEGPSFVWHFRGKPHVHIWINVADDPSVKLNTF